MYLNIDRQNYRRSLPVTIGVGVLASDGQLDESYFEHFFDNEDDAKMAAHALKLTLMKKKHSGGE